MRAHDEAMEAHDDAMQAAAGADSASIGGEIHSSLLLTSAGPGPSGWRVAGYRAWGPPNGPRLVGVLRARDEAGQSLMNDVKALLDRNVRG